MAVMVRQEINQYLTFKLADEMYAINVGNIKEVLGVPKITKLPRMPAHMKGIINLRGNVVPVLDLNKKFEIEELVMGQETGIIVIELINSSEDDPGEELVIGIFSDEVLKVITIEPGDIDPPPKIGVSIDTEFLQGMGHVDNEFIMILNINKILTGTELQEIQSTASAE